jgi:hypothetical protein
VIASNDYSSSRWDILSALPISLHHNIEDRNKNASAKFEGAIGAERITARWCIRNLELRHI